MKQNFKNLQTFTWNFILNYIRSENVSIEAREKTSFGQQLYKEVSG